MTFNDACDYERVNKPALIAIGLLFATAIISSLVTIVAARKKQNTEEPRTGPSV